MEVRSGCPQGGGDIGKAGVGGGHDGRLDFIEIVGNHAAIA